MSKEYIVQLYRDATQWLAPWAGDPGRTCVKNKAKRYHSISSATYALAYARRFNDFENAVITPVEVSDE